METATFRVVSEHGVYSIAQVILDEYDRPVAIEPVGMSLEAYSEEELCRIVQEMGEACTLPTIDMDVV